MSTIYKLKTSNSISIEQLVTFFQQYHEQMRRSGKLADWENEKFALPYDLEVSPSQIYLKGNVERYENLIIKANENELFIELTPISTCGDKNKASILSKMLAKRFKAELTLPNDRTISYS